MIKRTLCLLLIFFSITKAELGLRLGICKFSCFQRFDPSDARKGYYWKDFTGVVPADAVPGGRRKGKTTFIGQAYDPARKGEFTVDIIPGQAYVRHSRGTNHTKIWSSILILCSKEQGRFKWELLTPTNFTSAKGIPVIGGAFFLKDTGLVKETLIGKVKYRRSVYVGGLLNFDVGLHINAQVGDHPLSYYAKSNFTLLTFANTPKQRVKRASFIDNDIDRMRKQHAAILARFKPGFKLGPCIFSCAKPKDQIVPEYYWRYKSSHGLHNDYFTVDENGNSIIAKTYEHQLDKMLAVAGSNTSTKRIIAYSEKNNNTYNNSINAKVFCTQEANRFEWIKVNQSTVRQYRNSMIKGGQTNLGTPLYVGRGLASDNEYVAGRVYIGRKKGRIVYQPEGKSEHWFEVLTFKKIENQKKEELVDRIWRYVGISLIFNS